MHKEYYIQFLPSILKHYTNFKVQLDADLAVLGFKNCIELCIENNSSTDQLYNIIQLIYRY